MAEVAAVFIAQGWSDQTFMRMWVKMLVKKPTMVLATDDVTDGNSVLLRQLRCSGIVAAVVRIPGVMRSAVELARARLQRDSAMAELATVIYDFGEMPGGVERFAGKQTIVVERLSGKL
jgi:hypothetical protein